MKIAMLAPLAESVPPQTYGGTERVISVLTEDLVRRGHDVTLFATGDSQTSATLVPIRDQALRLDPDVNNYIPATMANVAKAYEQAGRFDVIHNHLDYLAFASARLCPTPTVSTMHGRLDVPDLLAAYRAFPELPLVSISHAQREPLPHANWVGNVYNGIDLNHYQFRAKRGDYLVFLGRIAFEKRPDRAIEIARDFGMKLVIAAKIDPADQEYYDTAIAPLIQHNRNLVEFVGEVDEREKDELLGKAYANIFPIDWPEPFGLTMVESMATGTPVVTERVGSTPEVVKHGVTGFVCETMADMVKALDRIPEIDRHACRKHVEKRFSPQSMAVGYEEVYRRVIEDAGQSPG